MINNLLDQLVHNNIQLIISDNQKLKLLYQKNNVTDELKNQITKNKLKIMQRLLENKQARSVGFNIYGSGDLYEYRYGFGSYLYIERSANDLVTAWRANYPKGGDKPYKLKIIRKNSSFEKAFKEAKGFIDWLNKKNGKRY
ncbi:hypothetical protein SAMN04488134_11366 [Amphibacillus marinus]|uniref:TubC N-terminal docking domain-containing protein n=1 Tax=Amphibacillus marinus TaxID=872970 RepID=A0A1H8SQY6_9BACI|nr:hypothetical protein [Amphibacillus marinus]SEO80724.1 hypothetical protein SAMN04488134_11366 [Amphibacillus marinus]